MTLTDDIRAACARVASEATSVRIVHKRIEAYARELPADAPPTSDLEGVDDESTRSATPVRRSSTSGRRRRLLPRAGAARRQQVWDGREPTGEQGFRLGEGTFSATPLAWTHAQLVRLAWSTEAGAPVERPKIVADRYMSARG